MSTETTATKGRNARPGKRFFNVDKSMSSRQPVINKLDIAALHIDESFDDNCDPYNSTGQHLVGAVKAKQSQE